MAHARLRGGDSVRPEANADDDGGRREGWRVAQIKGRGSDIRDREQIELDEEEDEPGVVLSCSILLNPQMKGK
jgi:hypothetical protein